MVYNKLKLKHNNMMSLLEYMIDIGYEESDI